MNARAAADRWDDYDAALDQYELLLGQLRSAQRHLRDEVLPLVDRFSPPGLRQPLVALTEFQYRASVFIESAGLPLRLLLAGVEWSTEQASATAIVSQLTAMRGQVPSWHGAAADEFRAILPAQVAAAAAVTDVCRGVQQSLGGAAGAAILCYSAILALLIRTIAAVQGALASAVLAPAGALLAIGVAAVTALAGLASVVMPTARAMDLARGELLTLAGDLHDPATFPAGRWPRSRSKTWHHPSDRDG